MAGSVAYAATKAALDAFTITFGDQVGKYGITVNAAIWTAKPPAVYSGNVSFQLID